MPPRDDLEEHFRSHPRLRKYAEMFDAQKSGSTARQQRLAWLALLLVTAMVWYVMYRQTGNWNPFSWKGFFGHS